MGVSPAFHRRAVTVKGERGSRAGVDQGTDVTESLARQLDLVDPGELPGRGEWCLVGGAGPREKRRKISIMRTGLGGQERQGRVMRAPLGKSVFTGLAPPCNSPFLLHLRKLSSVPSSSSLGVAMPEFLAGCGEPLLNDLLACCSGDTVTGKG